MMAFLLSLFAGMISAALLFIPVVLLTTIFTLTLLGHLAQLLPEKKRPGS